MPADDAIEHRRQVRSLLALVRAVVQRSAASAGTVPDYAAHLMGRIDALARVQEILMRNPDEAVDLAELVADEFLSQGVDPASVDTPPTSLMLDRTVAASLALALHELTTNAIKFGLLQEPARHIAVRWGMCEEPQDWAVLDWHEQPLAAEDPPAQVQQGFGFELIRETLPYEIGARTRIDLGADGLHCQIIFCVAGPRQ